MTTLFLIGVWPKRGHRIMVFVSYCPKSSPTPPFLAKNKNQHPILNPCAKFQLNWLRNKKVMEKPHFRWNKWAGVGSEIRNDVIFRQCL